MAKRQTSNPGAARRRQRKAKAVIETRQKKEFTYRGKTVGELKELSIDEVLPLMPSGVRRSYTRGLLPGEMKFINKIENSEPGSVTLRTHYRHIAVLPKFVGHTVAVYDGKEFVSVEIMPEMIGHRLGEFALSTKVCAHSGVGVGATRSSKHVPLK
ncbi:MAG: 30S ribosomal protein S19 [Thermoplasmatota archaeon]